MAGFGSPPADDQANNPARQVGPETYAPPAPPTVPTTPQTPQSPDTGS